MLEIIEETITDPATGETITVRAGSEEELDRKWREKFGIDDDGDHAL